MITKFQYLVSQKIVCVIDRLIYEYENWSKESLYSYLNYVKNYHLRVIKSYENEKDKTLL